MRSSRFVAAAGRYCVLSTRWRAGRDDARFRILTLMKFDASRALKIVEELGGPRFAGPDWEARTAEFVAERMSALGLQVERCEVIGSRFPTRVAPWAGWLGYGV